MREQFIRTGQAAFFLVLLLAAASCRQGDGSHTPDEKTQEGDPVSTPVPRPKITITVHKYGDLSIPAFFGAVVREHVSEFAELDKEAYEEVCLEHQVKRDDSSNVTTFFSLWILHELFTSDNAATCARGKILDIPYFWHYIEPNPRYTIRFVSNGRLLKETPPPPAFRKYGSYADIDRTPYFFLSDVVAPEPRYYTEDCDTFCSFGWCSEREMAFTALLTLLGYEARVEGGIAHTWTEAVVPMVIHGDTARNYLVTIDNTFDALVWNPIGGTELKEWRTRKGETRLTRWYQQKSTSPAELKKIKGHIVPPEARQRIENKIVTYLRKAFTAKSWEVTMTGP